MKRNYIKAALGALAFFAASHAVASEELALACGHPAAGIHFTVTLSPELGTATLNRAGEKVTLTPDRNGIYFDQSGNSEAQFFPPDYPHDIMGSRPPLLMLGPEHFPCEINRPVVVDRKSGGSGGSLLNMQGRSLGGKLRAGPGTNFPQSGSAGFMSPLTIVRNTGVHFDGYDWFEVQTSSGRRAFQWGGIMCSVGTQIAGIFDQCERVPNTLGGNTKNTSSGGWMAFAIGSSGRLGHGAGPTRADAERYALQYCGERSCRIENLTQDRCQAAAQAGGGTWYGSGNNLQVAESTAHANCQASMGGGSCPIAYSYCR